MSENDGGPRASRELTLDPEDLKWINDHLKLKPGDLFHIPHVRSYMAVSRLAKVGPDNVRTHSMHADAVIENTLHHNMKGLMEMSAFDRPSLLIDPLLGIYYIVQNAWELKVLSVGPRSEAELLNLFSRGFQPENVVGLDLISYSEFVDLGDMHQMPYDDNSFDVVILGWVLAYSSDCAGVAREVIRVAKPNAYVAVGCERDPRSAEELEKEDGYVLPSTRFETTEDILQLFEGHIKTVPFRHDPDERMMDQVSHVTAILQLT